MNNSKFVCPNCGNHSVTYFKATVEFHFYEENDSCDESHDKWIHKISGYPANTKLTFICENCNHTHEVENIKTSSIPPVFNNSIGTEAEWRFEEDV